MQWRSCELIYNAENGIMLQLEPASPFAIPDDAPALKAYLNQLPELSALTVETGADLLECRFRFQQHNCLMQFEYYSQTSWIVTDSAEADVLLSALASHIQVVMPN